MTSKHSWTALALASVVVVTSVGAALAAGQIEEVDRSKVCMMNDQVQARDGLEEN